MSEVAARLVGMEWHQVLEMSEYEHLDKIQNGTRLGTPARREHGRKIDKYH